MSSPLLRFDKYSSKIKKLNIPLPSFSGDSKQNASSAEDGKFLIGRRLVIERLKNSLERNIRQGGSHLVTGYRGMGKTSLVDRVLYELIANRRPIYDVVGWLSVFAIVGSVFWPCEPLMGIIKKVINNESFNPTDKLLPGITITASILIIVFIYWHDYIITFLKRIAFCLKVWRRNIKRQDISVLEIDDYIGTLFSAFRNLTPKEWDRIKYLIHTNRNTRRYKYIKIKINLGQEILDEKSVLCVLTSELYEKYRGFVLSPIANAERFVTASILMAIAYHYKDKLPVTDPSFLKNIISYFQNITSDFYFLFICSAIIVIVFYSQIKTLLKLRWLSKWIDASIKNENSVGVKNESIYTTIGFKNIYEYQKADTRQIETNLISIIDGVRKSFFSPYFFFVFDELDKLESREAKGEESSAQEYSNERYLSGGGASRRRMKTVMHLLANMKFFTSSAKAHFIFIAGRELYDAYLADMTDRESTISSLFDSVTYVESFCKNERSERELMYNTEEFLARQLLPKKYVDDRIIDKYLEAKLTRENFVNLDVNLKLYYEYLICSYADCLVEEGNGAESQEVMRIAKEVIADIMTFLYHFTAYLYHVSNGSPKKMKLELERFVRPVLSQKDFLVKKEKIRDMLIGNDLDIRIPCKSNYLISFTEEQQRLVGFIHYISFPVNQIITNADEFGDKLLVSASFLINHLYKFHNGGFSWRNIEQTPELMEVYKIPGFRDFVNAILNYLLQTHIIEIPCGLYQFKFRKHVSEEISLASKLNEKISAIFNFTLDESLSVKTHYQNLLRSYQESFKKEGLESPKSLYNIHLILADLYMADEEFNNAIIEYQAALSVLDKHANKSGTGGKFDDGSILLAYIRTMLKLGIAFEKRGTIESAYNTYNEIVHEIICFREFDEKEFGLKYEIKGGGDNLSYYHTELHPSESSSKIKYPETILGKELVRNISLFDKSEKHKIIQKLSMIQDTRIIYQAMLARLFLLERMEMGGISRSNLDIIEREFDFIHLTTNDDEKFLVATDFFRRMGDIMYYKNGLIGFGINTEKKTESFVESLYYRNVFVKSYRSSYKEAFGLQLEKNKIEPQRDIITCKNSRLESWKNNRSLPCFACKYYNRSLQIIVKGLFGVDISKDVPSRSIRLLQLLYDDGRAKSMRKNNMMQLGEILDCFGNIMLSCSLTIKKDDKTISDDNKITSDFLEDFLNDVDLFNKSQTQKLDAKLSVPEYKERITKLEKCLLCYLEAATCYHLAGESKKEAGSLNKILRVILNYLRTAGNNIQLTHDLIEGIEDKIVRKILICYYKHYNNMNLMELQKLKWIFTIHRYENISLSNLTLFPDIEETMLNYYELWMYCSDKCLAEKHLVKIYNSVSMGALRHESTVYERVLALRFKVLLNKHILDMIFGDQRVTDEEPYPIYHNAEALVLVMRGECCNTDWTCYFPDIDIQSQEPTVDRMMAIEFLITDSLYCLTYIMETITPYTATTLFTNTFMGDVYYNMKQWVAVLEALFVLYKNLDVQQYKLFSDCVSEKDLEREDFFFSIDNINPENQKKQIFDRVTGLINNLDEEDLKCVFNIHNQLKEGKNNVSERFYSKLLEVVEKPNNNYLHTNYAAEMAILYYQKAKEMHREGRTYKNQVARMSYLDDDLKNDTIQFDLAIERYKINQGYHDRQISQLQGKEKSSLCSVERMTDNIEKDMPLFNRFNHNYMNINDDYLQ